MLEKKHMNVYMHYAIHVKLQTCTLKLTLLEQEQEDKGTEIQTTIFLIAFTSIMTFCQFIDTQYLDP